MGDLHFSCMPCEPLEAEERNKQKLHLRVYSYAVFLPLKARERFKKKKITPNRVYGQMDFFFLFFSLLLAVNMYIYVSI